ncbi:MAG: copper chaperone PCu(A)C [Alphaproteobacteria bacterium]|jgi:copper(I)-binding protein
MKAFLPVMAAALSVASAALATPGVEAAWSRPAAQGATGVGFMTLVNTGAKADALVKVDSPAARQVQIHQSSISGGVASMRMVSSVPVAPRGRVAFSPGGYHLMFLGLARAQKVGDRLPATLIFASGARIQTTFVVGVAAPTNPHAGH